MTGDNVHTLIGAYVLDAVDDVERAAVERHLAGCEVCAAEVVELRETAARLGSSAAVPPPAGMREQVLARTTRTRQLPPRAASGYGGALVRWRRWTAAAVVACLLAVGGGFGVWSVQQQRVAAERAQTQAAQERAADAERRSRDIAAVVAAPDAVVRDAEVPGGGRVRVVVSTASDKAVVLMTGLQRAPAGRAYQMWLIAGSHATSAGVMPGDATGGTRLLSGIGEADLIGVTVEPAGGSRAPTSPPVVAVELA
ncbi:MAG: anti-sigma factor [Micromonosporaceae bacterium]